MSEQMLDRWSLDANTVQRIKRLADVEGVSMYDAVLMALSLGLELCERGRVDQRAWVDQMARDLAEVKSSLHVLGPAVLGTNLLLLHWAIQSGSLKVSADELSDEFKAVAGMEWAQEMARRGVLVPPQDAAPEPDKVQ